MAKQHQHKPQTAAQHKKTSSAEFNSFTYLLRNFIIVLVIGFLFMSVYKMNEKQGQLPELYQEFQQLRQSGANQERQQELYNEMIQIQGDTSFLKSLTKGYYWAIHDMALGNLKQINEMKEAVESGQMKPWTLEDKLIHKVGVYSELLNVNKNTPKDAVILLPPGDSLLSNTSKWNFIYDPEWVEYFIYPRLCLATGRENEHPDLLKRITHVLIVEGRGYDKLKYDVPLDKRRPVMILPIDHPPVETTTK